MPFVTFLLFVDEICDGCKIVDGMVFHTFFQFEFECEPRKVRKFHIVVLQYPERFLAEHHLL